VNSDIKDKLLNAHHLSLEQQIKILSDFILSIDDIPRVLDAITKLPNAWLGAGVIFQNVWNVFHGFAFNTYVKDIDIFYWEEEDLSWRKENSRISHLNKILPDIDLSLDVKNIARVHLWYEHRFGIKKTPYKSVQESIGTWPVIGACIAVREKKGKLEFIAPYGFQDMFSMRIRANKVLVDKNIYQSKALIWQEQWPLLSVEPW
jgi:hypothetical protein